MWRGAGCQCLLVEQLHLLRPEGSEDSVNRFTSVKSITEIEHGNVWY